MTSEAGLPKHRDIRPSDVEDYMDITKMPRQSLEQHYMSQMHFLLALVRSQGGMVRIPRAMVVDLVPRNYRIYMDHDLATGDYILLAREEQG